MYKRIGSWRPEAYKGLITSDYLDKLNCQDFSGITGRPEVFIFITVASVICINTGTSIIFNS